jgi:WD40 repeat protein
MSAVWKTVRVFISSTFRDMHAERDYLVRFVFRRLREDLLKRRINLVDVDLRWGVTSEQDALEVCRKIIDECRPRFLCILGGRYGWTPPGQEHSITAEEIRYGVLDRLGDQGYAYFHFRDPADTDSIPEAAARAGGYREFPQPDEIQQYGLAEAEARARQRMEKLAALKQAIVDADLKPTVYPATWDDQQQRLAELEWFGEQVYRDLWESVLDDPELRDRFDEQSPAAADEFTDENEAMDAFVAERTERYVVGSRQGAFDRLAEFAAADAQPNVLAVTGSPGCGKSALLGKFFRDLVAAHRDWLLVPHFVGASAGSTDLRRTLRRLCHELQQAAGGSDPISQDVKELIPQLLALLNQAAAVRRVVLVFDALNQMDAADGAHSLNWLPMQLPANVRLVISSLEHPVLETLRRRGKLVEEVTIHPLTAADAEAIIEGFAARYHKRLSEEQTQQLLGKPDSGTPLYLLVALEELRTLGTYEEITGRIAELPGNVRDLFLWILRDRLSADPGFRDGEGKLIGADLVRQLVSYLGVSRHGLSHRELAGLIAPGDPKHDPPIPDDRQGNVAALERLLRPYLMRRGELLDFYHGQLREAVEHEYLDEPHEPPAAHRALAGYFAAQVYNNRRTLEELPYHQTRAGLWDELEATLTDLPFLEGKTQAGMAFELVGDFSVAVEAIPADRPQHRILRLLEEALRRDIHFIAWHAQEYPQGLFQCLWNSCWWYDCPEAVAHYVEPEGGWNPKNAPWLQPSDQRLCHLLERWRVQKHETSPGFHWLRSHRPPPIHLGTAQQSVFFGHEEVVASVTYSLDGRRIASGGGQFGDYTVRVWNTESGAELAVLRGHENTVTSVTYSPDGRRIASGSLDNTVRVWDAESGAELAVLRGHEGGVSSVTYSPDGRRIASGSGDKTVRVLDAESGAELVVLRGHEGGVSSVTYSPDGRSLASGSWDKTVRVWDAQSGTGLAILQGHEHDVTSVSYSADGRRIASGSVDKTVRVWDAESGAELAVLRGHEDHLTTVSYSPNGRRIASASWDKTVRVWDAEHGAELALLRGNKGFVIDVLYSPDGRRIAIREDDDPDGFRVGSASEDNPIRVLDAQSGTELGVLRGGISEIMDFTDSWDERQRFYSGSWDKTARLCDAKSGECLEVIQGRRDTAALVANPPQFPLQALARGTETVVAQSENADPIAWFPTCLYGIIAHHPSGHAWAGAMNNHVYIITLEGGLKTDQSRTDQDVTTGHTTKVTDPLGVRVMSEENARVRTALTHGLPKAIDSLRDWVRANNAFGPHHKLVTDISSYIDEVARDGGNLEVGLGSGLTKSGKAYLLTTWHETFFCFELSEGQDERVGIDSISAVVRPSRKHDCKFADARVEIEDLRIERVQDIDPTEDVLGSLHVRDTKELVVNPFVCISYTFKSGTKYGFYPLATPIERGSTIHFRLPHLQWRPKIDPIGSAHGPPIGFAHGSTSNFCPPPRASSESDLTFPLPVYVALCVFDKPDNRGEYCLVSNTLGIIVDSRAR